jgi:dephospho-CoA kinase
MKILKIAVTGSAGSGKSLVCGRFKQMGIVCLDCDHIARQVVEPGMSGFVKIVELFGETVVREDGRLDRKELRSIIVSQPDMRKKMEDALHPRILGEMANQMEGARLEGERTIVVEVPLLFELGMEDQFDVTLAVKADDTDLVSRICHRDGVTKKDAQRMLDLQMSQENKAKKADHVIVNTGLESELFDSVDNIFEKIQKEFLTT